MGQDSWNLMFGTRVNPKTRKGTEVSMHNDEGYGGPKVIPGYNGTYKNSKTKVIGEKVLENPVTMKEFKKKKVKSGAKKSRSASESFMSPQPFPKKRK